MKKTSAIRTLVRKTAALALTCFLGMGVALTVQAEESWKTKFDEICGKAQSADSLNNQELATLVEKADKLAPEIQKSDEPAKKVYLQRLKKCRSLYEFMLDTRQSGDNK